MLTLKNNYTNLKRGFTLFELIIVVLIISIVYVLAVPNLSKSLSSQEKLSFKNLSNYLSKIETPKDHLLAIVCLDTDGIKGCFLEFDGYVNLESEVDFNFDENNQKILKQTPTPYLYEDATFAQTKIEKDKEIRLLDTIFRYQKDDQNRFSSFIIKPNDGEDLFLSPLGNGFHMNFEKYEELQELIKNR